LAAGGRLVAGWGGRGLSEAAPGVVAENRVRLARPVDPLVELRPVVLGKDQLLVWPSISKNMSI
jgi:hypothetical protein